MTLGAGDTPSPIAHYLTRNKPNGVGLDYIPGVRPRELQICRPGVKRHGLTVIRAYLLRMILLTRLGLSRPC